MLQKNVLLPLELDNPQASRKMVATTLVQISFLENSNHLVSQTAELMAGLVAYVPESKVVQIYQKLLA